MKYLLFAKPEAEVAPIDGPVDVPAVHFDRGRTDERPVLIAEMGRVQVQPDLVRLQPHLVGEPRHGTQVAAEPLPPDGGGGGDDYRLSRRRRPHELGGSGGGAVGALDAVDVNVFFAVLDGGTGPV